MFINRHIIFAHNINICLKVIEQTCAKLNKLVSNKNLDKVKNMLKLDDKFNKILCRRK